METTQEALRAAIYELLKEQPLVDSINLLTAEMTEIELQTVIQVILDPEFHSKQASLTNPRRFMVDGELTKA